MTNPRRLNYQPLPSYTSSRIYKNLRNLESFTHLQKERPLSFRGKRRTEKALYGAQSNTSSYRANRVATQSLNERQMTGCERLEVLFPVVFEVKRDPNARTKYSPVIINGRIVR